MLNMELINYTFQFWVQLFDVLHLTRQYGFSSNSSQGYPKACDLKLNHKLHQQNKLIILHMSI